MAPSVKTPPFVCWKIEKSIIKLSFSQSLVSPRRKRKDNQSKPNVTYISPTFGSQNTLELNYMDIRF